MNQNTQNNFKKRIKYQKKRCWCTFDTWFRESLTAYTKLASFQETTWNVVTCTIQKMLMNNILRASITLPLEKVDLPQFYHDRLCDSEEYAGLCETVGPERLEIKVKYKQQHVQQLTNVFSRVECISNAGIEAIWHLIWLQMTEGCPYVRLWGKCSQNVEYQWFPVMRWSTFTVWRVVTILSLLCSCRNYDHLKKIQGGTQ